MSRLLALLTLHLAVAASAATLPLKINFQGKLLDPADNSPRNGAVNMQFRVYAAPSGGSALWTEPASGWSSVQVNNGVFSVQLGTTVALTHDLFTSASAYLGVTVQGDTEMSPRQQLAMSAYAFTAGQLASGGDVPVRAGTGYSTFTTAGHLLVPESVVASTISLRGSLNASSATLTLGGDNQYSLHTGSGIYVASGTLTVQGSGGVAVRYGVTASTAIFTSSVTARQFYGIGATTAAFKPSDESVASSIALQDDDHLVLPIGASETWVYDALVDAFSTSATPDFKMAFTAPAGATMKFAYLCASASLTAFIQNVLTTSGTAGPLIPLGASIVNPCHVRGTVVSGATAGYVHLQWAQNTSNGTATTVRTGSHLIGTRIE